MWRPSWTFGGGVRCKGLGATTIGGKMIDYGSFRRAESLLAFAGAIEERDETRVAQ
jgi:citrate lyase beta subunit